jgi:hypothetical protein
MLVTEIASLWRPNWGANWKLAALLHDAPEYVVGDLISPFKAAVGIDYKKFELRLLAAIHMRFSVPIALPDDVSATIKRADRCAAFFEATQLAGFTLEEGRKIFGAPKNVPEIKLKPLPATAAQAAFVALHAKLMTQAG